jgi:DNA repair ATPase RecN
LKSSIENEVKAIAECLITILNIEQLKLELLNSIDELKGEDGQDNRFSKNLEEKIESIYSDAKRLVDSLSDGSSYSSFKDAIDDCESYLKELMGLASNVKDSRATNTCKQRYAFVLNYIQKAMKDFATVPEINSAMKKNLNDIEKTVPTYASDVRKHLNEYNSIERNGSPESKKRFVETVSRMLTGYDRMGRVYTKANRMITQIDKSFKLSAYKTSEYLECKESWEIIEQAMTELDRQSTELSSCVENLKSQLEALLGGQ